jgi:hypothetical protein
MSGSKVLSPAINVNSANDMLGEFDVDDLVNHNVDSSLDNSQLLSVTPNTEHKRIVQQYRKPPVPKQRSSSASSANSPGGVRRSESFGSSQNNFTSNSSSSANARLTLRAQEALKKHQVTKRIPSLYFDINCILFSFSFLYF